MQVRVKGNEVYLYTGGRRFDAAQPTVVFVHGAANDHSVWALQSRYFAHHGWNALALDLPGHGRSAGAALVSVEALAGWLLALLDALGVNEAALVGHSLGALASLEAAAQAPERVTRLALLGPAVPMSVSEQLLAAARDEPDAAYRMIVGWSLSFARQLGGNAVPGMWLAGSALRLMQRTAPGVLHVDLSACNAYSTGLQAAGRVTAKTLVLMGGRDLMAPPKAAQALIGALARGSSVTLPEAGHSLMAEAPDAVLDALRAFLVT
jgi:pimeloyl-ACP methyl ester carboxylesterase